MQYNAKAPYIVETHWQIEEVLDGDSIIICNRFTQMKKEIRLYGLDALEVKLNRKMKEDEEKSSLPAQLLLQFGLQELLGRSMCSALTKAQPAAQTSPPCSRTTARSPNQAPADPSPQSKLR